MSDNPKVFVSYSWSSPDHEGWVLQLATDLVHSGVEVILDKWDLREGQEASAFMEKMVTDQAVKKVIIVADRVYVEKANQRKGGAGTEAQIISSELFKRSELSRFAALVRELDEHGKPCLPAFYTSRIYIDFTEQSRHDDSFEQLLRWIFEKPLHRKPKIGPVPHFIANETNAKTMPTATAARRANDAIREGKAFALSASEDYFRVFVEEVQTFRLTRNSDLFSDEVIQLFDDSQPYRNEAVSLIDNLLRYVQDKHVPQVVHNFIEGLWNANFPSDGATNYRAEDFDVVFNLTWEIVLHISAISYRSFRPDVFQMIIDRPYHIIHLKDRRDGMQMLDGLSVTNSLLKARENIKDQKYYVPEATLLKSRASIEGISFEQLAQADFLVFLRTTLANSQKWIPKTLVYHKGNWERAFPAFSRAKSKREFERLTEFIGIDSKDAIEAFVLGVENKKIWVPTWGFDKVDPRALTGLDNLATLP
jgi:hypothetical protein